MLTRITGILAALLLTAGLPAGAAQATSLTLYSEPDFRGESITLRRDIDNFEHLYPWNDRARSLVVHSGTWEVCKHAGYRKCRTLAPGARIGHLGEIKYLREISSARVLERHGRHDPRWGDRDWDDRGWDDRRHNPYPPGGGGRPPRWNDDDIVWDNHRDWNRDGHRDRPSPGYRLSACQQSVYDGFVQRFGRHRDIRFTGSDKDGTIWWDGSPWRYRCDWDKINIWQDSRW